MPNARWIDTFAHLQMTKPAQCVELQSTITNAPGWMSAEMQRNALMPTEQSIAMHNANDWSALDCIFGITVIHWPPTHWPTLHVWPQFFIHIAPGKCGLWPRNKLNLSKLCEFCIKICVMLRKVERSWGQFILVNLAILSESGGSGESGESSESS